MADRGTARTTSSGTASDMTTAASDGVDETPVTLELRGVSKTFGPVVALRSGTLTVDAGTIHGLVGENGAGKSTLVKVVAGVDPRDEGCFAPRARCRSSTPTAESKAAGVAVIDQEPMLFRTSSVTEKISMVVPVDRWRCIERGEMYAEAEASSRDSGCTSNHDARAGPVDRRPADHRDRQGDIPRRQPAHHGRADRGAQRRGGRAAVAVARSLGDEGRRWSSSHPASTRSSRSATPSL